MQVVTTLTPRQINERATPAIRDHWGFPETGDLIVQFREWAAAGHEGRFPVKWNYRKRRRPLSR